MEPIPETSEAVRELDALAADDDLLEQLVADSEAVRAVVPDCIGMSVTLLALGVTFTLVASAGGDEVVSTLSLPLVSDGDVIGGVNLYGSSSRAFHGHHDKLAQILGASARDAVTDADLDFRTQDAARRAPGLIRDTVAVEVATGMLAGLLDISVDDAQRRLSRSALRAGLTEPSLARTVSQLVRGDGGST